MPIALIRGQVHRTDRGDWYFGFTSSRQGANVGNVGQQDLPHATVLQIYRQTVGPEPATGLEAENIHAHWGALEPRLRVEIQNRVGN